METLNNDIKYGNFTTQVNKAEGFPLDQEALSMLQNNMRLMATMAEMTGAQFLILCGCGSASSRQPGYVYVRTSGLVGEILYYDGSAPTSGTCHIWEDSETVTANLVTYPNAYTRRCLRGGPHPSNSSQNLQWSSFKKFDVASMSSQISSLLGTVSSLSASISATSYMIAPIGTIQPFAGSSVPSGYQERWKICDGTTLYRSAYPDLAAALGVTSGTTFSLPNLKGQFLVGLNASDSNFNRLGIPSSSSLRGKKEHSFALTIDNIPEHYHQFYADNATPLINGSETSSQSYDVNENASHKAIKYNTSKVGKQYPNAVTVPTLPPFYVVNYIIRAK